MISEYRDLAGEQSSKELLQHQTKAETRAELASLTTQVSSSMTASQYLAENDYFGLEHFDDAQKNRLNKALKQVKKAFIDIPFSGLPIKLVRVMLSKELAKSDKLQEEVSFASLLEQLKKQALSNNDYLHQVLQLAQAHPNAISRHDLEAYQKYQTLLSPSLIKNDADRHIIHQKFAMIDITMTPDPVAFIQAEVMGDPQYTGISIKTQNIIKEAFNIPVVRSGSDIQHALNGANSDGTALYTSFKPLLVRPGVNAYLNEAERQILKTDIAGRASRRFDITGWSAAKVTRLSNRLTLYALSEQAGISSMLTACYDIDFALGDDFDLDQELETQQVLQALLGFNKGYDGRIIDSADMAKLKWQLQIFSRRGDASQGDNDIDTARASLVEIGVRDKKGNLNIDVLKEIGSYTREIYLTGEPRYESLKKYISDYVKT